jgi:hypothetical protein
MNANFQKIYDRQIAQTPANYLELTIAEKMELTRLAVRGRFGATYVLPFEVIRIILKERKTSVSIDKTLLSHHPQIMNYILRELNKIPVDHYGEFRNLLYKSISAFQARHFEASQALATVVLDSLMNNVVGKKIVTTIRHEYPKPRLEEIETFQPIYRHSVLAPISEAFAHSTKLNTYSRNVTVHAASLSSINQLNALKSITLLSSIYILTFRDFDLFSNK